MIATAGLAITVDTPHPIGTSRLSAASSTHETTASVTRQTDGLGYLRLIGTGTIKWSRHGHMARLRRLMGSATTTVLNPVPPIRTARTGNTLRAVAISPIASSFAG